MHASTPQPRHLRMSEGLILSLFPGIDLLGRGFELEGYCVVRGPDPAIGQSDVRDFNPPPRFDGIIAGSPCQDFSRLRRDPPSGEGAAMLREFIRIVRGCGPKWWLLENVPTVPDVLIDGYSHQRIDLSANEFGLRQRRLRHFQFGSRLTGCLSIARGEAVPATEPCAVASEGEKALRRSWGDFCALQGLEPDFEIPYFTLSAKYRAVGNGVPIPMGRAMARAIKAFEYGKFPDRVCACGCGREVEGKQRSATPACRKRLSRRSQRKEESPADVA